MEQETVVITGISGYVGSQVCKTFLESGRFKVKGTVRSTTNEAKIAPLRQAFGDHFNQLELVEADLLDEKSLFRAIEGAQYVVHTASPFPITKPKHEDDLIKPAVNGTMAVMRAAKEYKVKRVVITSSIAATQTGPTQTHHGPDSWTDLKNTDPYSKSKTLAEQAAWDFVKNTGVNEHRVELATINPGLVTGPNLIKCQFSSGDIVKSMMTGKIPANPKMMMPVVDVRDIAKAHLNALITPEADGKRFLMAVPTWFIDMAKNLKQKYPTGRPIKTGELSYCIIWTGALCSRQINMVKQSWGVVKTIDISYAQNILGIEFTPIKTSLWDMCDTLIATEYVK